ncbi:hypothetical protein CAPTEDRAFT_155695 [Capitella teleta]|uniref:Sodium/bile acid cotransporter n=1 Tax=Capitella teleta TaxID=283909 RepID=R7UCH0_CAPTE|nr:hypothetical protein CAPTEDRAFT_155695 [Capitella teleta]|eukprot:ELU03816.1 hypothetical protein CAPTEDRAFT_155695 [Capitella teleta]
MLRRLIAKHWFLLGIIVVIIAAHHHPEFGRKKGPLKPEVTVKYLAISVIFFNSGLSLKTEELLGALLQLNVHAFIQVFTLLFVPLLVWVLVSILETFQLDPWLLKGFLVVGSMPPPVSSAVILTKAVGGNEAAAIFNSAFGSFLGIIITPMWLLHFMGIASSISLNDIFIQLSITVVLPLISGQIVRVLLRSSAFPLHSIPFGSISSATLLLIIYTTFCDTFLQPVSDVDSVDLLIVVLMVLFLQGFLLLLVFILCQHLPLQLTPQDSIACLFCSTHKSLTLGIPILKVMFEGHPAVSVVSIPLLIYHPTQILLGGILVPSVRTWMKSRLLRTQSLPHYL